MAFWLRCALIISCCGLLACTADRDPGEKARTADAGMPAKAVVAPLPPCMWTLDACPEHLAWRMSTLLDARALDPDAHFIAMGGRAIGVSSTTSAAKSVVRLHMDDDFAELGERYRRYVFPDDVVDLIDVADAITSAGEPATVYALACRQLRAACSLWRVSADRPDGSELEEVPDSTFEGSATALIFDRDQRQPCVLDGSLHCFDGSWQLAIEPSAPDNPIRAVAMGSSTSVAVAGHGEYWTRPGVPLDRAAMPWTAARVDADVTWTGASDMFRGYFLIGEQGAFLQNLPERSSLCSHTGDFAASSGTVLVTRAGEVLFGLNEGRCLLQKLGDEPVLEGTTAYCRASQNLLLLRDRTILGTTFCARL